MQKQNVQQFELKASSPEGQRADKNTSPRPQNQTLNSVVDHRNVFIQIKFFDRIIEAICDSGASVSCFSIKIYDSLKTKHSLKMEPSRTQLKAANQLNIETRGNVRLPVKIGGIKVEHKFHVLLKSEADCLIGLSFLEDYQCDPLISKMKLRLNDDTCVALYHKVFQIQTNLVFCVVAADSMLVPASHSMIIPAHIPGRKRPLIQFADAFEPHERLKTENHVSADRGLFNFAKGKIPVMVTNCGD